MLQERFTNFCITVLPHSAFYTWFSQFFIDRTNKSRSGRHTELLTSTFVENGVLFVMRNCQVKQHKVLVGF